MARDYVISPADVDSYLGDAEFPARLDQLIRHARHNGAPEYMLMFMQTLEIREYKDLGDLTYAVTQRLEAA